VSLPLRTARLIVREFTIGDADELALIFGDSRVIWWEPEPFSREHTVEWIEATLTRYREDGIGEYAVTLAESGALIGVCGPAYREIEGELLPELGWDLRPDHWGHGYATEAARGVLTHAAELGLSRVYSLIDPGNSRSQGVARRIGMSVERRVLWADRPHDLWARQV
jgi:ribosomal-protein-alanine N-acetyltransferase